jgi:Tfp pilus assembly protein PilO
MQIQNYLHTFTFKKLISDTPLFVVISFTLFTTVLLFRFCILPLTIRIQEITKEYAYYQERISSENNFADIKQSIQGKVDSLKTKVNSIPGQQEITGDISEYLENLIAIARKSEIHFVRMQPQDEKQEKDILLYPILLVLTATYHELGSFVAALEKLPHLYRIDRLALDATTKGKCNVKLLLTCMIPMEKKK